MNTITSTHHSSADENKKVDAELKGSDFFQVAQYPLATMVFKQIKSGDRPNVYVD